MNNSQNSSTITLCGSCPCGDKNCPTLELQEDGNFLFRDDFNGQIQLTPDQLNLLFQKKEEIESLIATSSLRK